MIYDVVIVGAGPAGSQAAYILENEGYDILLIDKEKFPRAKACAGVLPPRIFSEISIPEKVVERPLDGYLIHSPSGFTVESEFPKPGAIVRREKFDDFLVNRLNRKPEMMHVVDFEIKGDCIELKGRGKSVEAKIVIGSDGANSLFPKHMKNNVPTVRKSHDYALGVQYEISLSEDSIQKKIGNWFEVFYTIPYGYGWISPLKDSVKVGLGGVKEDFKKNAKRNLNEFLDKKIIKEKVGEGDIMGFEAHLIPMKGPYKNLASDRLLLCGDAGGFVFPGTGEGVYYAIKSGRIAAEVADLALKNGKHDEYYIKSCYEEELNKNGLISLRDVDFIENVLSSSENADNYLLKLKNLAAK